MEMVEDVVSLGELSETAMLVAEAEWRLVWFQRQLERARELRLVSWQRLLGYRPGSVAWRLARRELELRSDEAVDLLFEVDAAGREVAMWDHFWNDGDCPF